MIPKLIPNEEFYNTISTGNRQYLYYQLIGKRVENCMNKFINDCEID